MISQEGARRRIIVTGATSGIGLETARSLARLDAEIILACRNMEKAERCAADIVADTGNPHVHVMQIDLASLASVRQFSERASERFQSVDVLINNAGIFSMKRRETADRFELTMGTNHLGPFLLTHLLLPLLQRAPAGRIVNLGSDGHRYGRIRLNDFQMTRWYGGFRAYAASRLATVLFTQELAARLSASPAHSQITVNCCHPGHVNTGIWPETSGLLRAFMRVSARFRIPAHDGAAPIVFMATDETLSGVTGQYFDRFEPKKIAGRHSDPALRSQVWDLSCELTGARTAESFANEPPLP